MYIQAWIIPIKFGELLNIRPDHFRRPIYIEIVFLYRKGGVEVKRIPRQPIKGIDVANAE